MKGYALITGSNGGIGAGIANYLLNKGHRNIACHYRSDSTKIASIFKKYDLNPEVHCISAELEKAESVAALRATVEDRLGNVDTLINVAGASTNGMSWKLTLEDFQKILNSNLVSTFLCSKEFIPGMRERKWGRIINFSSIVGQTGTVGASHYCAAKAGIIGFTKALALELANKNITANSIALGYFNTGLIRDVSDEMQQEIIRKIPVSRLGTEKDVGGLVEYLMSSDADFMTGQVLQLNGGQN